MSWRSLPRRALDAAGAAIVTRSLRASAEEYASTLMIGDTIDEATDGPQIAPIRHLIPMALARLGLCLDQIPGGWRIIRSPFPAVTVPAVCTTCNESWMQCGHGVGLTVAVNWDDPTEEVRRG